MPTCSTGRGDVARNWPTTASATAWLWPARSCVGATGGGIGPQLDLEEEFAVLRRSYPGHRWGGRRCTLAKHAQLPADPTDQARLHLGRHVRVQRCRGRFGTEADPPSPAPEVAANLLESRRRTLLCELARLASQVLGDPCSVGAGLGFVCPEHHGDIGAPASVVLAALRVELPFPGVLAVGTDDLRPRLEGPVGELALIRTETERRRVPAPFELDSFDG